MKRRRRLCELEDAAPVIERRMGMPLFEAVRLAVTYSNIREASANLRVSPRLIKRYMGRHGISKPHREVVLQK